MKRLEFKESFTDGDKNLELVEELQDNGVTLLEALKAAKELFEKGEKPDIQIDPLYQFFVLDINSDEELDEEPEDESNEESDEENWIQYSADEWIEMRSLGAKPQFICVSSEEDLEINLEINGDELIVQDFFVSLETWNYLIDILEEYRLLTMEQANDLRLKL